MLALLACADSCTVGVHFKEPSLSLHTSRELRGTAQLLAFPACADYCTVRDYLRCQASLPHAFKLGDLARQLPIHMRDYCTVSDYLRCQAFLLPALRSSGALPGCKSARMR